MSFIYHPIVSLPFETNGLSGRLAIRPRITWGVEGVEGDAILHRTIDVAEADVVGREVVEDVVMAEEEEEEEEAAEEAGEEEKGMRRDPRIPEGGVAAAVKEGWSDEADERRGEGAEEWEEEAAEGEEQGEIAVSVSKLSTGKAVQRTSLDNPAPSTMQMRRISW